MEYIKRPRRTKHLDYGHQLHGYVPYQQGTYNNQTAQQGAGTTSSQNTFTQGQLGAQGNLGNLWSSFLQGNIPSSFTAPQAAFDAFNNNFNTQTAPGLASSYGAGSPVLSSARALGLSNLSGQLYNTGVGNFLNALSGYTNYGVGMPTGNTGQTAQQAGSSTQGSYQSGINPLVLLANLIYGQ